MADDAHIPLVAFVCTHNSCRSIMAEAVARQILGGMFRVCSAGTDPKPSVDPDAIRTLRWHGYDTAGLSPKGLEDIPPIDLLVTMGCGVRCPILPCIHREDWALEDPTGRGPGAFEECLRRIEEKVELLGRWS